MEKKGNHYTEEELLAAIGEIKKGQSVRSVAKKFNIARSTLQRKVKDGVVRSTRKGPDTIFSEEQEKNIVIWIKAMVDAGFKVTKDILMHSVGKLAKEYSIVFPGGNQLPGRKWFESFMRRHEDIRMHASQNITTSRQEVSQERVSQWYEEVYSYVQSNDLQEALLDPSRIFNCDETAFFLNPKLKKVIAEKGSKKVYTTKAADEKFNVTAFLMGNAVGELAPPMIIYRYDRIPQRVAEAMPLNWAIGKSESGWMTQETFDEYITNIFEPYLRKEKIPTPVILFMDGHTSLLSLHISTFCKNNGIELVALLPNAMHLLQPMDVAVFHSLKTIWREEVMNFRMRNEGNHIQKHDFPTVLKFALNRLSPDTISNGFEACGLFPWDPTKVVVSNISQKLTLVAKKGEHHFLRTLEEKIGEDKLKMFSENVGDWNGPVELTDLYNLWFEEKFSTNLKLPSQLSIEIKEEEMDLDETSQNVNCMDCTGYLNITSVSRKVNDVEQTVDETNQNENFVDCAGYLNVSCEEVNDIDQTADVTNQNFISCAGYLNFSSVSEEVKDQTVYTKTGVVDSTEINHKTDSKEKNIQSPFHRKLYWPLKKKDDKRKRFKKEKLPDAVTSPETKMQKLLTN